MQMTRREMMVAAGVAAAGVMAGKLLGQTCAGGGMSAGGKVGWAFMGIGKLTTGQIVPALATATKTKLAGVITGPCGKRRESRWRGSLGLGRARFMGT